MVDAHGGESRVKQRADLPAIAIDFASGKRGNSMLEDAMVVEKLRKNLLSIPKLVQKKHIVVFAHEEDGGSYIKMRGRTDRIPLKWKRNAWVLRIYAESKKTSAQTKQRTNFLTHRKFAHVGRRALDLALRRNMLTGFKYHKLSKAEACKCSVCTKAMSKRAPFSKQSKTRSRLPGAVVHVDFAEVPVASRNGNKLAAIFTDDCVRYRVADYAKTSKGVHHLLQRYIDTCEERGFRLKVVRCDTQWVTDAARALARKVGFVFKASAPMCQSQDGVAERFMLTWANRVRAILRDQQRGPEYWEYASDMAIEISNCVPIADDAECTPWEGWHGSQPDVEHFCVPLCDVDFHVYSTERRTVLEREKQGKKLSDRRRQGVLIGYSHDQRSYKILRTNGKKSGTIVYRRYADCQFDQKCKLPKSEKARARSTEAESAKLSKELKKMLPNIESIDQADPAADDHDDGVASEEDAAEAPEEQ